MQVFPEMIENGVGISNIGRSTLLEGMDDAGNSCQDLCRLNIGGNHGGKVDPQHFHADLGLLLSFLKSGFLKGVIVEVSSDRRRKKG